PAPPRLVTLSPSRLLPAACCLPPAACRLLPAACCLPPAGSSPIRRDRLMDRRLQMLGVDRFGQVCEEAGVVAVADVGFHAVAADGDAGDRLAAADLPHQVESAGIGQADVADQHIE